MNFIFSCKGELLVMQDETWLEFWGLGQVIEFISFCFLICETRFIVIPDFQSNCKGVIEGDNLCKVPNTMPATLEVLQQEIIIIIVIVLVGGR